MPDETLEEFLKSKRLDGTLQKYEGHLEPFDIANAYVGRAIKEYWENFKQNKSKFIEIFDMEDYELRYRTSLKPFDSVYTKIYDGEYSEEEILAKIPDIARARIICRTLNQANFLKQYLVSGYLIDRKHIKQIEYLDYYDEPTSSGYRAVTYRLTIPANVLDITYDILYELQIRTEMQHTWAELSHFLFYKNRKLKQINKKETEFVYSQMRHINEIIAVIDSMFEEVREEVKRKTNTL